MNSQQRPRESEVVVAPVFSEAEVLFQAKPPKRYQNFALGFGIIGVAAYGLSMASLFFDVQVVPDGAMNEESNSLVKRGERMIMAGGTLMLTATIASVYVHQASRKIRIITALPNQRICLTLEPYFGKTRQVLWDSRELSTRVPIESFNKAKIIKLQPRGASRFSSYYYEPYNAENYKSEVMFRLVYAGDQLPKLK